MAKQLQEIYSEMPSEVSEKFPFLNLYNEIAEEKTEKLKGFVSKLSKLLPHVGLAEEQIIQIEVLVALSVESILTLDNLEEKAPMIRAVCEMIRFDDEKKGTAMAVAKRLLK